MNVWVLHISTKYGDDYRIFKTEEGAREQIKDYLQDFEIEWGGLFDEDKPDASCGYEWHLGYEEYAVLSREQLLE